MNVFIALSDPLLRPRLPKAAVEHIALRRNVTSLRVYVRMSRS